MRLLPLLVFIILCWDQAKVKADDEPEPSPHNFPPPYRDYEIVPGSISHDEKFAVILRDTANGDDPSDNLLVTLSPFQIVTRLPTNARYIDGSRQGGLNVIWAPDDTAVVLTQEGKFGPESITVLNLADIKVIGTTDLLAILQQAALPDFKESEADSFNGYFDFVMDGSHAWVFNSSDQIVINCEFTNNPRMHAMKTWTGDLTGLYDIKKGKLLNAHFTRTSGPH